MLNLPLPEFNSNKRSVNNHVKIAKKTNTVGNIHTDNSKKLYLYFVRNKNYQESNSCRRQSYQVSDLK